MPQIAPYIGRLLWNNQVIGTGFVVHADGLIATCYHVLKVAGEPFAGKTFTFEPLNGAASIHVIATDKCDRRHDVALLQALGPLPPGVEEAMLVQSDAVEPHLSFYTQGFGKVADPGQHYRFLSAAGIIIGLANRNDVDLLQLRSQEVLKGMSGGPIIVDAVGGVVGVVSGRYTALRDESWLEHGVWAARSEDIVALYPEVLHDPISEHLDVAKSSRNEHWHLPHPYLEAANFTGRTTECSELSHWLNNDQEHPLLVLKAMGGVGKSALAWYWLKKKVDAAEWPRVVWWSFYEGEASFDRFLADTLSYLGNESNSLSPRQQADALLKYMQQSNVLLIVDGFERLLRFYSGLEAIYRDDALSGDELASSERDCVNPTAEIVLRHVATLPHLHSKLLLITRHLPSALEIHDSLLSGCRVMELSGLSPEDAVQFLRAQGVQGNHGEIMHVCESYGFHPLALRLLAGKIVKDLKQPRDISVAHRLDIERNLIQRRHHVLEQAYKSLTSSRQKLLSRIACFRHSFSYDALVAVEQLHIRSQEMIGKEEVEDEDHIISGLDTDLEDLIERGLLQHDPYTKRFDLHPIVRGYAYQQLSKTQRKEFHNYFREYFAGMRLPDPYQVQRIDELVPVIELYHHTARSGQYDEAITLYKDMLAKSIRIQFVASYLGIDLLNSLCPGKRGQFDCLPDLQKKGWTLNELAGNYSLSGQPFEAIRLYQLSLKNDERLNRRISIAACCGNIAYNQLRVGHLRKSEDNLRRSVAITERLWRGLDGGIEQNELSNLIGLRVLGTYNLGRLLAYRGMWQAAEEKLKAALALVENTPQTQNQGVIWVVRALKELQLTRATASVPMHDSSLSDHRASALLAAKNALELFNSVANDEGFLYPSQNFVQAYWLVGAAYRENGNLEQAENHLNEALTRCRGINLVEMEADILLDLARLQVLIKQRDEALHLAQEAIFITERSGYVLQGADVHLFLAQMALENKDRQTALHHAEQGRKLAACDGPPDYTYKVAYEEAGVILEQLRPTSC